MVDRLSLHDFLEARRYKAGGLDDSEAFELLTRLVGKDKTKSALEVFIDSLSAEELDDLFFRIKSTLKNKRG